MRFFIYLIPILSRIPLAFINFKNTMIIILIYIFILGNYTMYQKKPLMLLFCPTFVSPFVMGKTIETTNKNILPEIVVYGDNNKSLSSVKTLSSDEISKTPTSNGNITDYLRSNPHIRYENSDQNGFQRGEIKPENISINGADPNQTAYFVDNVNINNDLAIDSSIFDGAMQVVPGISHTQAYFLMRLCFLK